MHIHHEELLLFCGAVCSGIYFWVIAISAALYKSDRSIDTAQIAVTASTGSNRPNVSGGRRLLGEPVRSMLSNNLDEPEVTGADSS